MLLVVCARVKCSVFPRSGAHLKGVISSTTTLQEVAAASALQAMTVVEPSQMHQILMRKVGLPISRRKQVDLII